jgi:hypothetical protein
MRRRLGMVLYLAALLLALTGAAPSASLSGLAQDDATPDAEAGSAASSAANPQIGDEVRYITESGSEVARLRVAEVVFPWEEYGEYYEPDPGTVYIAFVIEITNLGSRGNLIVRADDFRLQDVDGFFYSRAYADAADDAELVPTESEVAIGPDETEEVVAIYGVLDGVEMSHLFWQPDYERLLTVANLDTLDD